MYRHRPAGAARVVENLRSQGVNTISQQADRAPLVTFGNKLEAITNGALRAGLHDSTPDAARDQPRQTVDELRRTRVFYLPEPESGRPKTAVGVEIRQAKRRHHPDCHHP